MCWNAAANFPIIPNKHRNAAKKRGLREKVLQPSKFVLVDDKKYKNKSLTIYR